MAAAHSISDSGSSSDEEEERRRRLLSAERLKRQNEDAPSKAVHRTASKNASIRTELEAQSVDKRKTPAKRVSTFSVAKFIDDVSSSDEEKEEEKRKKAKKIKLEMKKDETKTTKSGTHSHGSHRSSSSSTSKKETVSSSSTVLKAGGKASSETAFKAELSDEDATDIDEEKVSKLEARRRIKKGNRRDKGNEANESHALSDSDEEGVAGKSAASGVTLNNETRKGRKTSPDASRTSAKTASNPSEPSKTSLPSSTNVSKFSSAPSWNPSPAADSRPQCRYGLTCYRQKPSHWNKCSHPDEVCEIGRGGKTVWIRPGLSTSSKNKNSSYDDEFDNDDDDDMMSSSVEEDLVASTASSSSSSSSSSWSDPRLIRVLSDAEPHNYFLTKVGGIENGHNAHHALSMRDILSPLLGTLESSVQFNYCIDIDWMMNQYPPQFRRLPVLVVHGLSREAKAELIAQASQYSPHVRLAQAKLPDPFGTHHTKMMILKYKEGLRVAITTANLISHDWHQKTQGIWLSPLFPPLNGSSEEAVGDSKTGFKRDLLGYIRAYRLNELKTVEEVILSHDMSSCRVYLLGSIPGRHQGAEKFKWGHMRLRRILEEHQRVVPSKGAKGTPTLNVAKSESDNSVGKSWYLMAQFSSLGSLGNSASQWLQAEFAVSLSSMNPRGGGGGGVSSSGSASVFNPLVSAEATSKFRLVFPCVEDVANSLEGYQAGASIPYARATAAKQTWLKSFLHKWRADRRGRTRAAPHIKSFAQIDPTHSKAAWFVSTSANLSKAAWGALEKNQSQLFIRSYELGVVFLPEYFFADGDDAVSSNSFFDVEIVEAPDDGRRRFPFPLDLPLTPYSQTDEPWLWDVNHTKVIDSHGGTWEPNK